MNCSFGAIVVTTIAILFCSVQTVEAQTVQESFIESGVTRKVGGYRPIPSKMDQESDIVQVAPKELQSPNYGYFQVGNQKWAYILDEEGDDEPGDDEEGDNDGGAILYLDSNGDGDLTNDPETTWTASRSGEFTMYSGSGTIDLGDGKIGAINFYRFDPDDGRRASLTNTILYYTDFGYEYTFQLDGKEFSTFVSGTPGDGTRLPIDRDGNGKLSRRFEVAFVGKPFNFTGTTYVFKIVGAGLSLEKATEALEQMPFAPDLSIGKQSLPFTATTMDGDEIKFPESYKNKIVMLDFWATWCGPCIGEIPHMKKAYSNWHENGFEILGVSFDRADMEERILAFLKTNEQPWSQIYEGKMWDTTLGTMHDVSGIPFVLLVDGDSGEILATAQQLRGPGLSEFIKHQLEKKFDIELESKTADARSSNLDESDVVTGEESKSDDE